MVKVLLLPVTVWFEERMCLYEIEDKARASVTMHTYT